MSAERSCPNCRRPVAADDRFCSGCGTSLGGAASAPSVETVSGRPGLDQVFAHLRSGEQRPATVLMSDIAGFTTFGEGADPEWVFNLINEVFAELGECILAHGGHIDKYVGDEVMALFGVPFAQERSAERAVRAALAMHDRLNELNRRGRFGGLELGLHTGINLGPVMVGPVGHRRSADYTVIGDAVNVTKRLEDEAPTGEIYVSEAVRDAVCEAFELQAVGSLLLSGRRQPENVYRVKGARPTAEVAGRAERTETPTVGRESEWAQLAEEGERTVEGAFSVVCVAGPPGIGKSRLIAEWQRSPQARGFQSVPLGCHAFGEHFPLLPIVDLVTRLAGVRLDGWPPRVSGDLAAAVSGLPLGADERTVLRQLLVNVGPPADDATGEWRAQLCAALQSLLRTVCSERPLCVILEDVHWIDESSRAILTEALAARDLGGMLLLLSARDPGDAWPEQLLRARIIRLAPLSRSAMEQLIERWAAPTALPRETVRALGDRAQGHPYFARELIRALKRSGSETLAAEASLPNTLQELFLAQLDSLPRVVRHLVQSASVVGEPLSASLLQSAMGDEAHLAFSALTEAVGQGLLRAGPAQGQFSYARRLLFEAAYTTIPPSRRRKLHARIAAHLEDRLATMGETAVHAVAYHAYLGYRDVRAVALLLRSAKRYRDQCASRLAVRDATRAVELISALPAPDAHLEERLEALWVISQAYQVVGDLEHAEGTLAEAELLAEKCPNSMPAAHLAIAAATLHHMRGRIPLAAEAFRRARDAYAQLGEEPRVGHALLGMGLCAQQSGDRSRAVQLFEEAAQRSGELLWVKAAALNNAGMALLEEGRYAEAESPLREGLRANEESDEGRGDRRGIAHSHASLGELCYRLARFEEAQQWLAHTQAEAREIEDGHCEQQAVAMLVRVLVLQNQTREAEQLSANLAPGAEDPELAALCRLARLEAACAGEAPPRSDLLPSVQVGASGEGPDLPSAGALNAQVEALCVALECALTHRNGAALRQFAAALAQHVPLAVDVCLRRYGEWLLSAGAAPDDAPLPGELGGTVFAVRANRLAEAL
ncbi:MAG: hypothetical protein COY42_24490 [Armatimonadetes bacterium CG_4_10_14_0_8_um_filter_66_14]|nr:AAA family ATPase [Armatimonadota bacterium]NCP32767.1 AAA family ATPase [Armatimonadota bacterium]PIX37552.1 MAG: hypothetical protein COZ57_33745 [Armatimonadetes bacterium CG_4_8_14_3_um_filter_66_20]PIZ37309.1 MAG: hypothetical protein COY42_24490 [Armatimonadetes bacterium CG_4_10_14_0_8_um_filter_66_14]PJB63712.1 MAG: hypothetical protein CO096_21355 [Armatimonadetes bacterium CG_4_9_14_3_um_filter_66_14]